MVPVEMMVEILILLAAAAVWVRAGDISKLPGPEVRAALPPDGGPEFNRLIHATSPYLLQHARNPVDWYEWGDAAFEKATAEDKPVFLSVGYSTCHWCHVMARESFESETVAAVLNEHFVSIKVDREERPDVDDVYMTFVQATTQRGGWPMSVFLTPDRKPFYGGTYFPEETFLRLLDGIRKAWSDRRGEIEASATRLVEQIRSIASPHRAPTEQLGPAPALETAAILLDQYDAEEGGFGPAPKFPRPVTVDLLLAAGHVHRGHDRAEPARAAALHTLRAMARGGMYDQIGGGFHRYSVDTWWHVPHFEKMLYDQGQLVASYVSAWQLTGEPCYAEIAREVCGYVLRDLTHPDGGFYSAEDADSVVPGTEDEHGEGAFYVWSAAELRELLGEDFALAATRFGIAERGNVRPESDPHGELSGMNVLYRAADLDAVAAAHGIEVAEAQRRLEVVRERLMAARAQRSRPHLDDKVITAWNGLMIGAMARAGAVLDEPELVAAATAAAAFIEHELWDADARQLYRVWRSGKRGEITAFAADHAYLAAGLVELFVATGEARWLQWARELHAILDDRFAAEQGGWFEVSEGEAELIVRGYETYDGAEPAASSVAANTAQRLAIISGDESLHETARHAIAAQAELLGRAPHAAPLMVLAWMRLDADEQTVVVAEGREGVESAAGAEGAGIRALRKVIDTRYLPFTELIPLRPAERDQVVGDRPWLAAMQAADGHSRAFFCQGRTCQRPTSDPEELAAQMDGATPGP